MAALTSKVAPPARNATPEGVLRASTLSVSEPDAVSEREADRLADAALRGTMLGTRRPRAMSAQPSPPADTSGLFNAPGRALDPPLRRDLEARFCHDFSGVRVHANDRAEESAEQLDALAFTVGQHIGFARGAYAPQTSAGRELLAHELAHTVQAQQGRYPNLIHRRRVPSESQLSTDLPPASDRTGLWSARIGLARLLSRAWASLNEEQRDNVRSAAAGFGIEFDDESDLRGVLDHATHTQLTELADAIRREDPTSELGDPTLSASHARPGTADQTNMLRVVTLTDALFAQIVDGSHDAGLAQIFGSTNVRIAKDKYSAGRRAMNALLGLDAIVVDRSGYSTEVHAGGLSNATRIAIAPSVIDDPDRTLSQVIMLHESMHAGNADVIDRGYVDESLFTQQSEEEKLTNAAHYEVIPRRILQMEFAYADETFTPAGSGATPTPTQTAAAVRAASDQFTAAWNTSIQLHNLYRHLFSNPTQWNTASLVGLGARAGARYSTTLPFWSYVERLTIHSRLANIDPTGSPANHPVTTIDLALSEGFTRKLAQGMDLRPNDPAAALALEATATDEERRAAARSVDAERDLLIRLVLRSSLGEITGREARDVRVIARLAEACTNDFTEILRVRSPSDFD